MSRARQARRKEKQKGHELAEEAAVQARTSQRKSVVRLSRGALVAVAVTAVGFLVTTGISDVAGSSGQPLSARVDKEVSALLSGIPQSGETLGQPSAPITLQIFGDLESANVRTFVVWLLPAIIREWVRTNIVKIQYRSFMTASLPYPNIFASQQAAALAAGVQDRLWNFIATFYHEQGKEDTRYVTEGYLNSIARQIPGLEFSEWENDYGNSQLKRLVSEDNHAARALRFHETPVFLIGRTGGKPTRWPDYRLYEEPSAEKGFILLPAQPLSFITSKTLKLAIEHLIP
jgi:protein-disulfide isomerase